MDKFVQRKPSWKTKTYEAVVAKAAQKTQRLQHHAAPVRRPLQEHPASNVTPKHLNQPQNTADTMRASEKMPDVHTSAKKTSQPSPVARPIVSQPMTLRSISQGPSVETKNNVTTTTSRPAGPWARLQNDINSPSASLRVRAIRALKSPTRNAYNVFDVPHTEQSIISADERTLKAPLSLQEVMSSVVVYVDVRSGNDNRSDGVKTIIADMGAQINDRLLRNTTHVIFKDGLLSTYKKAMEWKIPVVSVLWLEGCKSQRRVCEPEKFPITSMHKYEFPELYGKITRVRCMQPGSELAIRPSRRPVTPTSSKENGPGSGSKRTALGTPTTTAKNDISRFFKALNHNKQIAGEAAVESPATKILNRIANGSYTPVSQRPSPLQAGDRFQVQEKPHDSGEKLQAQKILNFNEKPGSDEQQPAKPQHRRSTAEASPVATPVRTSRRRSSAHISMTSNADASQPPQPEQRVTRRRSSAHIPLVRNQDDVPPPLEPRTKLGCSSAHNPMTSITEAASETEPRMTRRRSSAHILTTINVDDPPPAEAEPRLKHRRSSAHIPMASNTVAVAPPQPDLRMTRRRSSFFQAAKEPLELTPQNVFASIAEELAPIHEDKSSIAEEPAGDATESNCQTKMDERMADAKILNKTDFVQHSLEISVGNPSPSRVLYQADKRGTLYTSERMDISKEFQDVNLTARKSMSNVTMQTSTLLDEHSTPPMFSSTRLPTSRSSTTVNRRRTLFNLDMEVINENINRLNSSHRLSLLLANQAELGECGKSVVTAEKSRSEENPSNEPKRRLLFTPNEVVVTSPPKTNKKQRLSFSGNNASTQSRKKRRRSLAVPACPSSESSCLSAHVDRESTDKFLTPDGSLNNANDIDTSSGMNVAGVEKSATSKRRSRVIRTLVHTNMHQGQVQGIQKAIRKLRRMRLDPTVTNRTTHLVSVEPRRTLNLLRGLMRGVWIVNFGWIQDSLNAGKWLNEEKYELKKFSRAIEICRTERQAFGIHYHCELFRYMEPFYVSSLCRPIEFNNMKELLLLGGAKMTENRFKAKYIIGDKRRVVDDRIYLTPYWVLDSITAMQIQKFGKYLMKSAIVTPSGIRYEDPRSRSTPRSDYNFVDPPLVMDK
ncbi:microcephalin-like isoform X1 [Drosophila miranda]|uniref:microcephalin-like isoform X1 n=1 Tax=Drosophila miranda TaxID=7229 RepID=UPI00143FB681|nr:microcephalin-like isoform X1 [Drosophila miranda]